MTQNSLLRSQLDKEDAVFFYLDLEKEINQSTVKNHMFNTDVLKCINTIEHDTGEFFLTKDLVAYSFDSMIDRMIIMKYHGAVEVLDEEFYFEFEVVNKSNINAAKSYELVVIMYQPMLLTVNALTKDITFKF